MMTPFRGTPSIIRIALFVSSELEDEGLTYVISHETDMDCCCHYVIHERCDVWSFSRCDWKDVDVAVMMLPFQTLEEVIRTSQENFTHVRAVVVIKESWHWSRIARILNYGVAGLTNAMDSPAIMSMVRLAHYHSGGVDSEMVRRLLSVWEEDGDFHKTRLKPLDYQVWGLMAEGRSNPEISEYCGISISHAKRCVHRIFRYLNVHDRTHAIALYQDYGMGDGRNLQRIEHEPLEPDG